RSWREHPHPPLRSTRESPRSASAGRGWRGAASEGPRVNDVLAQIVARPRERLRDITPLQPARSATPFAFSKALSGDVRIIAEIKSASPSAGTILENPDVETIA